MQPIKRNSYAFHSKRDAGTVVDFADDTYLLQR
jgi:hypothetical protein